MVKPRWRWPLKLRIWRSSWRQAGLTARTVSGVDSVPYSTNRLIRCVAAPSERSFPATSGQTSMPPSGYSQPRNSCSDHNLRTSRTHNPLLKCSTSGFPRSINAVDSAELIPHLHLGGQRTRISRLSNMFGAQKVSSRISPGARFALVNHQEDCDPPSVGY